VYSASADVTLPVIADGNYRIIVVADAGNAVFEAVGENNNTTVSTSLGVVHPDLTAALLALPAAPLSGSILTIRWQVTNAGSGLAPGAWIDRVFLSADTTPSGDDTVLGSLVHNGPLADAGSYTAQLDAPLPIETQGVRFILIQTDVTDQVIEFGAENNNVAAASIDIQL